jgi:ferrous-iron efflux pump FieF
MMLHTHSSHGDHKELRAPQIASALSVAMAVVKLTVGISSGSLSLIASGIDSAFDAVASILSFILLKMSLEPADKEHPYGHSRIEPMASLAQALFLFIVAVSLGYLATQRFDQRHEVIQNELTMIVALGCTVVTFWLWIYLGKIARKTNSSIISADRLHYFVDLASNVIIFIGFLLARFLPIHNIDAILTLILCVMILTSVYEIVVEAIKALVDQHDPETEKKITSIIKGFYPQALGASRTRSRKSGRHTAVDLELLTCREMKFQDVHDLSHLVEQKILSELPTLDIIIHSEPCLKSDCPTVGDCQNKSQVKAHL